MSRASIVVRDATESDALRLCLLWAGSLHRATRPEADEQESREQLAGAALARTRQDPLLRILVAEVDGAFTLKRYAIRGGRKLLVPENDAFPVIPFGERDEIAFFGVVTFTVKAHGRGRRA